MKTIKYNNNITFPLLREGNNVIIFKIINTPSYLMEYQEWEVEKVGPPIDLKKKDKRGNNLVLQKIILKKIIVPHNPYVELGRDYIKIEGIGTLSYSQVKIKDLQENPGDPYNGKIILELNEPFLLIEGRFFNLKRKSEEIENTSLSLLDKIKKEGEKYKVPFPKAKEVIPLILRGDYEIIPFEEGDKVSPFKGNEYNFIRLGECKFAPLVEKVELDFFLLFHLFSCSIATVTISLYS